MNESYGDNTLQPNPPNLVEHCGNRAFGAYVCEELRKLNLEMIPFVKKLINEAIFEGQMESLNRTSRIVTEPIAPTALK